MSQSQRIGLIVVGVALALSLIIAFYINSQKNQIASAKANIETQLEKTRDDSAKKDVEIQKLNSNIQTITDEKTKLEQQMEKAAKRIEELSSKIDQVTSEKDKWQQEVEKTKKDEASLNKRIGDLTKQIEGYKAQEEELAKMKQEMSNAVPAKVTSVSSSTIPATVTSSVSSSSDDAIVSSNDTQWAGVLKDKAGLEVQLENLKSELAKVSQELVDVRQKNGELQVSLDSLTEQKISLDRELKYKTDLVNNLSLDLARAKNDQRLKEERIQDLGKENEDLRNKIKQLVSTNGSMEKSLVRLNQDKRDIEKKLDRTEDLVYSKINEIWDIKTSIDQTMAEAGTRPGDVELPPIKVNNQTTTAKVEEAPGIGGQIVSVNANNNFVIVSVGQKNGVKAGDTLSVYRGSQYIGRVQIIQVRGDISAADIKEQSSPIQLGDLVK